MATVSKAAVYTRANHSFSGVDIKAVFAGKPIGTCQAISYAITREKAPVYTMGDPDPRAFSRGKRAIAGSMVFIMFDSDPLITYMQTETFSADKDAIRFDINGGVTPAELSSATTESSSVLEAFEPTADGDDQILSPAWYADQVPPFDIYLFAANEYGAKAEMRIYGVEITDEGHGMSVDDVQLGKQMKWIARYVMPWNAKGVVPGSPIDRSVKEAT